MDVDLPQPGPCQHGGSASHQPGLLLGVGIDVAVNRLLGFDAEPPSELLEAKQVILLELGPLLLRG